MKINQIPGWLTKEMIRDINKENLEAYLLALEGWRRGLKLTWYYDDDVHKEIVLDKNQAIGNTFSLSNKNKTHYFFKTIGDKMDKHLIKYNQIDLIEKLKSHNLQTIDYILLSNGITIETINNAASEIGLPVEILIEHGDKEVTAIRAKTEKDLNEIQTPTDYKRVLIKKVIEGDNYNIYSVNKKIVAVVKKMMGENVDNDLDALNFQDVTDTISSNLRKKINDIISKVPDLNQFGMDIIVENDIPVINNVAITDNILKYTFPLKGKPINIAASIIDSYFPETVGLAEDRTKVYFDYRLITKLLRRKHFYAIQVEDAPKGKLFAKRYVVSGKVQQVGYRNWIRRQANKQKLHGYTRNLKNGKVVVVVASENENKVKNFKKYCEQGPEKAVVEEVKEYDWNSQIKAGFEIRKTK